MEVQQYHQPLELAPIQALCPVDTLSQKSHAQVFRAQCMIPFHSYSLKVVFYIAWMGVNIYCRIDMFVIPMIFPEASPIDHPVPPSSIGMGGQIPIASYSFNCVYCARCNLGLECKSHVPPSFSASNFT